MLSMTLTNRKTFTQKITRKKIINTGIILSIITVLYIMFLLPSANAGAFLTKNLENKISFIESYGTNAIYTLFAESYTEAALTFGNDFIVWLQGLACVIAIIIMVVRIEENLTRGKDDIEAMTDAIIGLCFCFLVVLYVNDLLDILNGIGSLVLTAAKEKIAMAEETSSMATFLSTTLSEHGGTTIDSLGPIAQIGLYIELLIPFLMTLAEAILIRFVAFSIIIELGVRRIFMAFAVVDIYGEGMRSPGMRYIKKYLACWIRMAFCMVVAYLGSLLAAASVGEVGGILIALVNDFAIAYTTISVMMKGQDIANDVVGV